MRLLLVLLTLAAPLFGDVLYLNGGPNYYSAESISSQALADDFILTNPEQLTQIILSFSQATIDPTTSDYGVAFLSDSSGSPGTLLYTADVSGANGFDTGNNVNGNEEYSVTLAFSPGPVLPAGTYWLALRTGAFTTPYTQPEVDWDQTDFGLGSQAYATSDITGAAGWSPAYIDLSFEIDGQTPAATPEPATLFSISLPLLAALLMTRRR